MEQRGRLTAWDDIKQFVRGGRAKFTLVSIATGKRFTYRVVHHKTKPVSYCYAMTGTDNEHHFRYMGSMPDDRNDFYWKMKSNFHSDAPCVAAFRWFVRACMATQRGLDQMEFWHEGKCARCGRPLTVPASIARGMGPTCAEYFVWEYQKAV